jgi:hypothetical protein
MAKANGAKLLEMLNAVTSTNGPGCFFSKLSKGGKEFVEACVAIKRQGRHVSAQKLSDVLGREFKFQIGEGAIRRHLLGSCQCVTKPK